LKFKSETKKETERNRVKRERFVREALTS